MEGTVTPYASPNKSSSCRFRPSHLPIHSRPFAIQWFFLNPEPCLLTPPRLRLRLKQTSLYGSQSQSIALGGRRQSATHVV
jgi:hypothetical protein